MTCILVDDEPLARQGLERLLAQEPATTLVGSFGSAAAAGAFLATTPADLLLLDINMPELNGLDFARALPGRPLLIFTTAYPQFAAESYELDAVDYLLKPIRPARLQQALHKAALYHRLLQQAQVEEDTVAGDHFFVRADRRYHKVLFQDVLFIKGLKDYVIIHTATQKLITAMNIKAMCRQLPAAQFLRVGKSFVVNVAHITSFDTGFLYLGEEEIPLGAAYRDSVLSRVMGTPETP